MRNRQMIVHWLMANTNAIEARARGQDVSRDGGSAAFQGRLRKLLAEVQRHQIGGRLRGRARVVRSARHSLRRRVARREIVGRVDRLNLPSYRLRAAAARARDGFGRHDRGRAHLVSLNLGNRCSNTQARLPWRRSRGEARGPRGSAVHRRGFDRRSCGPRPLRSGRPRADSTNSSIRRSTRLGGYDGTRQWATCGSSANAGASRNPAATSRSIGFASG